MPKTNLRQQIVIDALPSKVWKVLTSPDYLNQYLFEGMLDCGWKEGSRLLLTVDEGGRPETMEKGRVLRVVPGVLLHYHLQDETIGNHSVSFELVPASEGLELKLCCEGFEDSDDQYRIRQQQSKLLLQKIKWLAEYA